MVLSLQFECCLQKVTNNSCIVYLKLPVTAECDLSQYISDEFLFRRIKSNMLSMFMVAL